HRNMCNSSRKGIRDDSTTSTVHRRYAIAWVLCKNSRGLHAGSPSIGGTLPPQSRQAERRGTAAVLSVSGQREEMGACQHDHRAVRDQVLLRADAATRLAHTALLPASSREEAAGDLEPRRSAADSR